MVSGGYTRVPIPVRIMSHSNATTKFCSTGTIGVVALFPLINYPIKSSSVGGESPCDWFLQLKHVHHLFTCKTFLFFNRL